MRSQFKVLGTRRIMCTNVFFFSASFAFSYRSLFCEVMRASLLIYVALRSHWRSWKGRMCIVGQSIVRKIPLRFQVVGRFGGWAVWTSSRSCVAGCLEGALLEAAPQCWGLHSLWRQIMCVDSPRREYCSIELQ